MDLDRIMSGNQLILEREIYEMLKQRSVLYEKYVLLKIRYEGSSSFRRLEVVFGVHLSVRAVWKEAKLGSLLFL